MSDKHVVRLEVDHIGDLLQEVVRAYLHSGMPSGMLRRVCAGMLLAREEITSEKDVGHLDDVVGMLATLKTEVGKLEQQTYREEHVGDLRTSLQDVVNEAPTSFDLHAPDFHLNGV